MEIHHSGVQTLSGLRNNKDSRNSHIRGSHSEKPNNRQRNQLHDVVTGKAQGYQGEELKERKYDNNE